MAVLVVVCVRTHGQRQMGSTVPDVGQPVLSRRWPISQYYTHRKIPGDLHLSVQQGNRHVLRAGGAQLDSRNSTLARNCKWWLGRVTIGICHGYTGQKWHRHNCNNAESHRVWYHTLPLLCTVSTQFYTYRYVLYSSEP